MHSSPRAPENETKLQLLGLTFAGADLAFEVAEEGRIGLVLGAAEGLSGRTIDQLAGSHWLDLFAPQDQAVLQVLWADLSPGQRRGPLRIGLRNDIAGRVQHIWLSAIRLPQRPQVMSFSVTRAGAPMALPDQDRDGLISGTHFASAAEGFIREARASGLILNLDLVELPGLAAAARSGQGPSTRTAVAAALRAESLSGLAAAEVAADRFALLRSASSSSSGLPARLQALSGGAIRPVIETLPLGGDSAAENLRAMRYALDRYIEDGAAAAKESFGATVKRTVAETARLKTMVADRTFKIAYQPVADLQRRGVHHFEALARFEPDASPAAAIRLAEELEIIPEFDLAVAASVAQTLRRQPGAIRIAINVSAFSLLQPGFVPALLATTSADPALRSRLLIELTETARLGDLDQAGQLIAALREAGHEICLDDFGAGAASLEYLRHMDVDYVKIDGRYVRSLESRPRDGVLVRHIVALCRSLGVRTIAEMVETESTAQIAADLGVEYGQGWFFGKAVLQPPWETSAPMPVRRRGDVEEWR